MCSFQHCRLSATLNHQMTYSKVHPSLYYPVDKGYVDADGLVELINLVGVLISVIIASDIAQHALLFLLVTAICFAPWQSINFTTKDVNADVGCWPKRFLLFKLMFMSGIVKIQAECPTWQNLMALEYHFATQCVSLCFRAECTLLCLHSQH